MKKIGKWLKGKRTYRYINGGKGVISILLAALMLPFLTLASYLVETGRYHEAVTLLDEAMDSASLSVLAEYDPYLRERFGLLAFRQDLNVKKEYQNYLEGNLDTIAAWEDLSLNVKPGYALTDGNVLIQQITEFSKYSAPTALIGEIGISELIAKLEDMTHLTDIFDLLKGAGKVTNSTLELTKSLEKLEEDAKQLESDKSAYESGFGSFQEKAGSLASAIQETEGAKDKVTEVNEEISGYYEQKEQLELEKEELERQFLENELEEEVYQAKLEEIGESLESIETTLESLETEQQEAQAELDAVNEAVTLKRTEYENARNTYSQNISSVISSLNQYMESIHTVNEKRSTLYGDLASTASDVIDVAKERDSEKRKLEDENDKLKKEKETLENEPVEKGKEKETEERIIEINLKMESNSEKISGMNASKDTMNSITETATTGGEEYINIVNNTMDSYREDVVQTCASTLNACKTNVDNLAPEDISGDFVMDSSRYYVSVTGLIEAASVKAMLDSMEDKLNGGGFLDALSAIGEVFQSLCKLPNMYDTSLSAYIAEDASYAPSDIDKILAAISELMGYFDGGVLSGIINILTHILDVIKSLIKLLGAIITYLAGVTARIFLSIGELVSGKAGEKFLLDEYLLKTLKNRNSTGGTVPLTGYSYSDIPFAQCNPEDEIPIIGAFTSMVSLLSDIAGGSEDKMFCGAELEYILVGSRSEIINQVIVFFDIYFVRLLLDVIPIVSNPEVINLAEAAGAATFGIGAVVVYVLEILIEPLIETFLIVDGEKISLLKKVVYLTPSGMPTLLGRIVSWGISAAEKDKITTKLSTWTKTTAYEGNLAKSDSGFPSWNYENYMFVFMLLFGENNEFIRRFQNIINLETNAYYGDGKFQFFDTYTYLEAEVSGKYNLILPMDKMADAGVFSIKRKRARGY